MPDSNLPPRQRSLLRWVGTLCYLSIAAIGWVGSAWPASPELNPAGLDLVHAVGFFTFLVSLVLAGSVVFHRWRIEYVLVWWASAGVSAYIGIAATIRPVSHGFFLIAGFGLFACLTLISRGISLSIFASRTKYASGV